MATVTAGNLPFNFDVRTAQWILDGFISFASASQFSVSSDRFTSNFIGSFTYNGKGFPTGGTVSRFIETYDGRTSIDINNIDVPMANFIQWAATDNTAAFKDFILGGADSLTGSSWNDLLRAYAGADSMIAAIKGMKWESPRGPIQMDPASRDIAQSGGGEEDEVGVDAHAAFHSGHGGGR